MLADSAASINKQLKPHKPKKNIVQLVATMDRRARQMLNGEVASLITCTQYQWPRVGSGSVGHIIIIIIIISLFYI